MVRKQLFQSYILKVVVKLSMTSIHYSVIVRFGSFFRILWRFLIPNFLPKLPFQDKR